MADGGTRVVNTSNVGAMDFLEKDLTCSICTDILYQPLTLLNCLHTFCGSCLKEWFKWQAVSAAQNRRSGNSRPYTCPSCRESVRGTKVDWRPTDLLERYLKEHPEREKTEQEKTEIAQHYKISDDVLPPIANRRDEGDSDDERLLADIRELSMAGVDPETARRRAQRATRHRRAGESAGRNHPPRLTEARMREHDAGGPHIGHQPSLRSLLSVSDTDPQDVQAEILQSIYSEGLLDGIDIDNLTTEQEEELTERIAEAYRRRQRRRDRSRSHEPRRSGGRTPRSSSRGEVVQSPEQTQSDVVSTVATVEAHGISRPHVQVERANVFGQTAQEPQRAHRRSTSATSQVSSRSNQHQQEDSARAARSATDSSLLPPLENERGSSGRRRTPSSESGVNDEANRSSGEENRAHNGGQVDQLPNPQATIAQSTALNGQRHDTGAGDAQNSLSTHTQHEIRPAPSKSMFAPEPITTLSHSVPSPSISCNHCQKHEIQYDLHYNCNSCLNGSFNLCLRCYREGKGCHHWYGFGYRAIERWNRTAPQGHSPALSDRPHILTARRYIRPQTTQLNKVPELQEGAFCDRCFSYANDSYWYCSICLDGAWGFCESCVKQGHSCTHPLLPVAHISTQTQPHRDPKHMSFVPLPHMKPDTYAILPVPTFCDICHRHIPPSTNRFHCPQCNAGDYDICQECYHSLTARGKISSAGGPGGWRRCPQGHRMAIIGHQNTADGGHLRLTVREPVGGHAFKEDTISLSDQIPSSGLPPDGGVGMRCLALYSYFPADGVTDELSFPKNAEIREVGKTAHEDWLWGVYAGDVNLFPSNHVRML